MKNLKKHLDAAATAIAEAQKAYQALLDAANNQAADETDAEEETQARILYWDGGEETNLEEMNLKELKAFAKDAEIALTAKDADGIRQEIYDAYNPPADEDAEEADADAEEEEAEEVSTVVTVLDADDNEIEVDLADMDVKGLKAFAKTYGLEVSAKAKDDLIQEIISGLYADADAEDAEPETEEEEEQSAADQYGLTDMTNEELAEVLASHGLSPKGKREALIDRVLKGIEDGTISVEESGE